MNLLSTRISVALAFLSLHLSLISATIVCRTPDAPSELLEAGSQFAKRESLGLYPRQNPNRTLEIPVYFHVITSGYRVEDGWVSGLSIQDQVLLMNKGYKRAGISFKLMATEYHINSTWANSNGDPGLLDRQRLLRRGDYRTLNIFLIPGMGNGGRCSYPSNWSEKAQLYDRCEVGTGALPHVKQRVGRTVLHEVGHWMGLLHTFEGGCDGDGPDKGDQVADTPAHKHDFFGIADCPKGLDTCPGQPGLDPTSNYMSYFAEKCMNEETGFTDGQIRRMWEVWDKFRAKAPGGNVTVTVPAQKPQQPKKRGGLPNMRILRKRGGYGIF